MELLNAPSLDKSIFSFGIILTFLITYGFISLPEIEQEDKAEMK